jgi:tetratricopeptide (TPR) repeat protein
LLPPDSLERLELLLPYAYAVGETGQVLQSRTIFTELHERATAVGERRLAARARVGPLGVVKPGWTLADAEELVATFAELGDETGLAQAYRAIGMHFRGQGRCLAAAAWYERALVHARASGDLVTQRTVTQALSQVQCWGPTPVGEATARCEELRAASSNDRVLDAVLTRHLSSLYAMAARFDDAREAWEQAGRVLDQANMVVTSWVSAMHSAVAKELAGNRAGAESDLKAMWHHTRNVLGGAPDGRAMHAAYRLAYFYCDDGRWSDAEECLAFHGDSHQGNIEAGGAYRHAALARLRAHRNKPAEAAALAKRAVEIAEATDMLNVRANIWLAMAEVRQAGGQAAEAQVAVAQAVDLFEQKGNVAAAGRLTAGAI